VLWDVQRSGRTGRCPGSNVARAIEGRRSLQAAMIWTGEEHGTVTIPEIERPFLNVHTRIFRANYNRHASDAEETNRQES
jgi:hypothetical protein